jgi:hypothetical protein
VRQKKQSFDFQDETPPSLWILSVPIQSISKDSQKDQLELSKVSVLSHAQAVANERRQGLAKAVKNIETELVIESRRLN